jgi:hypothetical protein
MFEKIIYSELNAKQKENYNFHKISYLLAGYGYNCMWLNDDWMGADFIAYHNDGEKFLKIQLKGRATLERKYVGKDIYIGFFDGSDCYVYPHDTLMNELLDSGAMEGTISWDERGGYSWPYLSRKNKSLLGKYKLI